MNEFTGETVLKLPKVENVPFFSEKEEWNLFKGTSITYIHENKKLLDIEKIIFFKDLLYCVYSCDFTFSGSLVSL